MKSTLRAFAALAALGLAAGLPSLVVAQEVDDEVQVVGSGPPEPPTLPVQDRRDREGRGGGDGGGRRDGGGDGWGRRDGGGGGWDRGDNGGGGQGRDSRDGRRDPGNRPGGWTPPDPGVTPPPPPQDGRDGWNRGDRDRRGRDDRRQDRGGDRGGRDRDRGDRWTGGDWNDRDRGGWDRNRGGGWDRDRDRRRNYDGFRNRWNQDHWRRDWSRNRGYDWWRNDRGFRGYNGFRFGFYFAPNYGYYSVPREFWGRRWYAGDYLPAIFWRYRLDDWRTYGLGYPPPGTQWVAVDNHIYLIDSYDGYIIEVIFDAWRW